MNTMTEDDLGLDLDIAERLANDPELQADEIEKHADLHRRAMATYEKRKADARRAGKERLAELRSQRHAAKAAYDAELRRIGEAMATAQAQADAAIATAERLAATSRAALAELEREG